MSAYTQFTKILLELEQIDNRARSLRRNENHDEEGQKAGHRPMQSGGHGSSIIQADAEAA